jgi:geranyl-CoA carboxylase alpha subunit
VSGAGDPEVDSGLVRMAIHKVLVPNRGEIAARIFRTARRLGLRTVAVFSEADRDAPHVRLADEAVFIGPAPASQSYLSIPRILDALKRTGADAVHPGYGFLSENADFARACEEAGAVFIGPSPAAIELMGNKRGAKLRMQEAAVPVVPGYSGAESSDAVLLAEAERVGFPLMVKAAAGGGGRGMRQVGSLGELPAALVSARAEAMAAFGSGELILERALSAARHVEVQIFGDRHGNVVHLGERDCSVQRRHQKVIEESPSPAVDDALRDAMGQAAVAAARAVDYVGAGTVEFLLDAEGNFHFLEMNTRLQVEHPVTELVTGLDLVEWQFRIADGEALPLAQSEIRLGGHAIEARLYAEDPASGFVPQTGKVLRWEPPRGVEARVDAGIEAGVEVGSHYDPMLAKVIVHAPTRVEACRRLGAALGELKVLGVVTNKSFLRRIVEHPTFVSGAATTAFLAEHLQEAPAPATLVELGAAALAKIFDGMDALLDEGDQVGFRIGGPSWSTLVLAEGEDRQEVRVARAPAGSGPVRFVVERGDAPDAEVVSIVVRSRSRERLRLEVDGVVRTVEILCEGEQIWLDDGQVVRLFTDLARRPAVARDGAGTGVVLAPLDGALRAVLAEEGAKVKRGQTLVLVEAMKMEHPIKADVDGVIQQVLVRVGGQVKARQKLVIIQPEEAT